MAAGKACVFCNDSGTIMDAAAYDWGMRAAYNLPQRQAFKPMPMMVVCPFCSSTNRIESSSGSCNGGGNESCWPLYQTMVKQGRIPT